MDTNYTEFEERSGIKFFFKTENGQRVYGPVKFPDGFFDYVEKSAPVNTIESASDRQGRHHEEDIIRDFLCEWGDFGAPKDISSVGE